MMIRGKKIFEFSQRKTKPSPPSLISSTHHSFHLTSTKSSSYYSTKIANQSLLTQPLQFRMTKTNFALKNAGKDIEIVYTKSEKGEEERNEKTKNLRIFSDLANFLEKIKKNKNISQSAKKMEKNHENQFSILNKYNKAKSVFSTSTMTYMQRKCFSTINGEEKAEIKKENEINNKNNNKEIENKEETIEQKYYNIFEDNNENNKNNNNNEEIIKYTKEEDRFFLTLGIIILFLISLLIIYIIQCFVDLTLIGASIVTFIVYALFIPLQLLTQILFLVLLIAGGFMIYDYFSRDMSADYQNVPLYTSPLPSDLIDRSNNNNNNDQTNSS